MQRRARSDFEGWMDSTKYREVSPVEAQKTDEIQLTLPMDHATTGPNEKDSRDDSEDSSERVPTAPFETLLMRKRFSIYLISNTIMSAILLLVAIAFFSFLSLAQQRLQSDVAKNRFGKLVC